jgi:hypothetical protein
VLSSLRVDDPEERFAWVRLCSDLPLIAGEPSRRLLLWPAEDPE